MVGLVTAVMSFVCSVTSTCLRSSFGDMRTRSGPMLSVSSGTVPGQMSTTSGASAPVIGHGTDKEAINKRMNRIISNLHLTGVLRKHQKGARCNVDCEIAV